MQGQYAFLPGEGKESFTHAIEEIDTFLFDASAVDPRPDNICKHTCVEIGRI